jgi:hypothetical protein
MLLVLHEEAVLVFELVIVAVEVRVTWIVLDFAADLVILGLDDEVFEGRMLAVLEPHAVLVLERAAVLVPVGDDVPDLDTELLDEPVLVEVTVLVDVELEVCVLDRAPLTVAPGEEDDDFELLDVLVEDIDVVVVLVVVEEGDGKRVLAAVRVSVLVRVEVFDIVGVLDCRAPSLISNLCSKIFGGLKAIVPMADNSRSQRIPL